MPDEKISLDDIKVSATATVSWPDKKSDGKEDVKDDSTTENGVPER